MCMIQRTGELNWKKKTIFPVDGEQSRLWTSASSCFILRTKEPIMFRSLFNRTSIYTTFFACIITPKLTSKLGHFWFYIIASHSQNHHNYTTFYSRWSRWVEPGLIMYLITLESAFSTLNIAQSSISRLKTCCVCFIVECWWFKMVRWRLWSKCCFHTVWNKAPQSEDDAGHKSQINQSTLIWTALNHQKASQSATAQLRENKQNPPKQQEATVARKTPL